jgi:DNA-binding transcriptional ArsR family regulator
MEHECSFRARIEWGPWHDEVGLRVREARRIPRCAACGTSQPARRPRPTVLKEEESSGRAPLPLPTSEMRRIAGRLATGSRAADGTQKAGFRGLGSALDMPGSAVEEHLVTLMRAGLVRLCWRVSGTRLSLESITVRLADLLEEVAEPGLREQRQAALAEAASILPTLLHPVAADLQGQLAETEGKRLDPEVIRAAVAVVVHAETGEVFARRVFSAQRLGGSKVLDRLKIPVERLVGPLEDLGIRDGGAVSLVGGRGLLIFEDGALETQLLRPYLGLPRDIIGRLAGVEVPPAGVLVVENLAVFEACCLGEVLEAENSFVIWSAGFPGRLVRRLVKLAAGKSSAVRVWTDLDLAGVRIARILCEAAGHSAAPWRMEPSDLIGSPVRQPLTKAARAAIRRELELRPDALMAPTLRAMLDLGEWGEQEVQLSGHSSAASRPVGGRRV